MLLDAWNFITRTKNVEAYALTTKYRLNKTESRSTKSAVVHRRRFRPASSIAQSEVDSSNHYPSAASTDFFDLDIPDDFDYDAEDDLLESKQNVVAQTPSQEMYQKACKKFKVTPANYFFRNLLQEQIIMKHHILGPIGGKVCAMALLNNSSVTHLDLTENDLGPKGAMYIAEMLRENAFIVHLTLAENRIGIEGASHILKVVMDLDNLSTLDLSGNGFRECDAESFRSVIEDCHNLKILRLCHNEFREQGGEVIGQAIEWNDSLIELDLSWNHLRRAGAVAIAEGLQMNNCLKVLKLSWNGFYLDGCKALSKSLEVNTCLQELDLSSNRITKECLDKLFVGLKKNKTLNKLGLAWNPIGNPGATLILSFLQECKTTGLKEIDIHTQVVDLSYVEASHKLETDRGISINYGTIRDQEGDGGEDDENELVDENPVLVLMEFGKLMGFRLMDLFAALDKDGSKSLDKIEIKSGLKFANIPLKEKALENLIEKLDVDGDGEIDFAELLGAQQEHRKKMNKMYQAAKTNVDIEDTEVGRIRIKLQRLMAKQMAGNPSFKSRVESFKTFIHSTLESSLKKAETTAKMTGNSREINRARVLHRRASQQMQRTNTSATLLDKSNLSSKLNDSIAESEEGSMDIDGDSVLDSARKINEKSGHLTDRTIERSVTSARPISNSTPRVESDITSKDISSNISRSKNEDQEYNTLAIDESVNDTADETPRKQTRVTNNSRDVNLHSRPSSALSNKSNNSLLGKTTTSRPNSAFTSKPNSRPGSAVSSRPKSSRPRNALANSKSNGLASSNNSVSSTRSRPNSATGLKPRTDSVKKHVGGGGKGTSRPQGWVDLHV